MSWLAPSPFEEQLFRDTQDRWSEIIDLARVLSLTTRIESLMLRNARLRFVPQAAGEIESLLWFSPLVAARSSRHIVFHHGVARLLADQLVTSSVPPGIDEVWDYTRLATRHWPAEDRLERDLRYFALRDRNDDIKKGLRDILRRIKAEQNEDEKIKLARWAKRSLPLITGPGVLNEESRVLAQFASLALGDSGSWGRLGPPRVLPDWLSSKLPQTLVNSQLGVNLYADSSRQVLHFTASWQRANVIRFPTPLPADVYVAPEGREGTWYSVGNDTRIEVKTPGRHLTLVTRDGRQYALTVELIPELNNETGAVKPPETLYLCYVEPDRRQAEQIRDWFRKQNIAIELLKESGLPKQEAADRKIPMIRLWTRNAVQFWESMKIKEESGFGQSFILRTDEADPPVFGTGSLDRVFDWSDWERLGDSSNAEKLLARVKQWIENPDTGDESTVANEETENEIEGLLKEIADPATEPPRRLEIGDRLAELGDPRPGVGVREIPMPGGRGIPEEGEEPQFSPQIQALLDEINDIKTEPPRRLAIGDELAKLGDPRKGVGLDEDGLPEIDWVEIPGGPFIYQDGQTIELPTFYISRYPVTNLQFRAFVHGGGYKEGPYTFEDPLNMPLNSPYRWHDLKKPEPTKSTWDISNRPRTDVDWYEAVAFCRWLSEKKGLPEDSIRLPTEQEWEKAARGQKGLIYPWGKKYRSGFANINETWQENGPWKLGQTTAVGMYPQGTSPYGVDDLAGNVWEWCLNKYDEPEVTKPDKSGNGRVLRGGSWVSYAVIARADYRYRLFPDGRDYFRGFRVLSSLPIR